MWVPRRRPFFRAVATGRASAPSRASDLARKNREKSRQGKLLARFWRALKHRNSLEFRHLEWEAIKDILPLLTAALVLTVGPITAKTISWVAVAAISTPHIIRMVSLYRSQRSTPGQSTESSGNGNDARHGSAGRASSRSADTEVQPPETGKSRHRPTMHRNRNIQGKNKSRRKRRKRR